MHAASQPGMKKKINRCTSRVSVATQPPLFCIFGCIQVTSCPRLSFDAPPTLSAVAHPTPTAELLAPNPWDLQIPDSSASVSLQ